VGRSQGRTIVRAGCGKVNLDRRGPIWLGLRAHLKGFSHEAVVSSAQQAADRQTWIPRPDGVPLGPRDTVAPSQEGPEAADRSDWLQAREPLTTNERLPRARRLVSQGDRTRCLTEGHRRRSRSLDFSWLDNTTGHPRMGLIVPKFQSTAVARNRLRRRLLELWRRNVMGRQGARDLLIRARRDAYQAAFVELRSEVLQFADAVFGPAGGVA